MITRIQLRQGGRRLAFARLSLLITLAIALVVLYYAHLFLPISASVSIFVLVAILLLHDWQRGRIGPMMALLFIVYALPFIHLVPYIWFDFNAPPPPLLWGIKVNPYMLDHEIINLVGMIGCVGAIGFAAGVTAASNGALDPLRNAVVLRERTMPAWLFLLFMLASIAFSWLAAPKDTIFTSIYTESASFADEANFGSAGLISYIFLITAIVDALYERSRKIARFKHRTVVVVLGIIVFWFQVLRGNRGSFPVIVAALLLYFVWGRELPGGVRLSARKAWTIVTIAVFGVFVLAYLVGALRSSVAGVESTKDFKKVVRELQDDGSLSFDNIITGTWSAVLLTPLSVAGDDLTKQLPVRHGATYRDFIFSMVPGPIADAIGYTRPIDAQHGPAWDMRYGMGGTHATVVPYLNFRLAGVFAIIALWTFGLQRIESGLKRKLSVWRLSFVAVITSCSPIWLWYGEKYVINAVILWCVIVGLERLTLGYVVSVTPLPRPASKAMVPRLK